MKMKIKAQFTLEKTFEMDIENTDDLYNEFDENVYSPTYLLDELYDTLSKKISDFVKTYGENPLWEPNKALLETWKAMKNDAGGYKIINKKLTTQ